MPATARTPATPAPRSSAPAPGGATRRQVLASAGLVAAGVPLQGHLAALLERLLPAPAVTAAVAGADGPLSLTWSSTLSQDYFLADVVQANPATDRIVPVTRSDGSLAVVLHRSEDEFITFVRPDGGSQSGYVTTQVMYGAGARGGVDTAAPLAAVPGPDRSVVLAFFQTGGVLAMLKLDDAGTVVSRNEFVLNGPGQVQGYVGPQGRAYFLSTSYVTPDPAEQRWQINVVDAASQTHYSVPLGAPTFYGSYSITSSSLAVATVGSALTVHGVLAAHGVDGLQLVSGAVTAPPLAPVPVTTPSGGRLSDPRVLAAPIPAPVQDRPDLTLALLWADTEGNAFAAACGADGHLATDPIPLLRASGTGYDLDAGAVHSAEWFLDPVTQRVTVYLLAGTTVYLQHIDLVAGTADLPLPIQTGVLAQFRPGIALSPVTRMIVATEDPALVDQPVLGVLSRRSSDGVWQKLPLRPSTPSNVEIDTYRTMLTVQDSSGNPVPGTPLAITPMLDLDVVAFTPTGAVQVPAGATTTLTTDEWGQICLATPATALYACPLDVQLGDATPVRVTPDSELHDFLQGKGTISSYATVTDALTANAGAGKALPGLHPGSIAAVAQAITSAMKAGANPSDPSASTPFTLSDLHSGAPTLVPHAELDSVFSKWWDRVKHDIESIWRAIEDGVAKVGSVASAFDHDLNAWVVQLEITIDDYVVAAVKYAIKGLRSAVVAIQGVLRALGADIRAVLRFLRTLLSGVFEDAIAIADLFGRWMTLDTSDPAKQGIGVAYAEVSALQPKIDQLLDGIETEIRHEITALDGTVAAESVAAIRDQRQPTPTKAKAAGATSDVKANYLFEKVRHTTIPGSTPSDGTTAAAEALAGYADNPHAVAAVASAHSAITALARSKGTDAHQLAASLTLADIATFALEVLDDGMALVRDAIGELFDLILHAIADLSAVLTTPLDDLPLVGDLIAKLGDHEQLTVGRLIFLVFGFMIAVIGDLLFDGKKWLPTDLSSQRQVYRQAGAAPGRADGAELLLIVTKLLANAFNGVVVTAIDSIKASDPAASVPQLLKTAGSLLTLFLRLVAYPFARVDYSGDWTPITMSEGGWWGEATPTIAWGMGFIYPALDYAALAVAENVKGIDKVLKVVLPIASAACGSVLLAFASAIAALTEQSATATTAAVLPPIAMVTKLFLLAAPLDPPANLIALATPVFDALCAAAIFIDLLVEVDVG